MPIRILTVMLLVATLQVAVRGQDLTGTVQGVVVGVPPAGAQIRASSDFVMVTTDPAADGSFTFTDLPVGTYQVQVVTATGRILAAVRVRLTAQSTSQIVSLQVRPPLAALGGPVEQAASFQAGPFGITPSVALLTGGVNTNVFNQALNPTSDNTFVLRPDAVVSLDTMRVRGEGAVNGQYVYFNKSSGERSLDVAAQGGLEVTEGRFTPWAKGEIDGGRRRINHEIDLRARQLTSAFQVGVDSRLASSSAVSAAFKRGDYGFDPDQVFLGANLQAVLNRRVLATTIEGRQGLGHGISALGQLNVEGDDFRFTPERDTRIMRVLGGIQTEQGNRAAGVVRVGYLRLNGTGSAITDYRGLAASADEDVRAGARTRLLLSATRDIDYSYDTQFPYYIRSAAQASLLRELSRSFDVALFGDIERMSHQPAKILTASLASYAEQYGFVGGSIQFRIAPGVRIGFDAGREERDTQVAGRGFIGYRYGVSVAVGVRPARVDPGFVQ